MSRPDASFDAPAGVSVRRTRASDAAAFARMMDHADVFPNLLQMPYASEEQWKARLADCGDPNAVLSPRRVFQCSSLA